MYGTNVGLKRWRGGITAIGLFFVLYALALGLMNINGFLFYWYGGEKTLQRAPGKIVNHARANSITQGFRPICVYQLKNKRYETNRLKFYDFEGKLTDRAVIAMYPKNMSVPVYYHSPAPHFAALAPDAPDLSNAKSSMLNTLGIGAVLLLIAFLMTPTNRARWRQRFIKKT
ncbi:MAG: hypothetical protein ACRBF0_17390 [Calditrichia bacterium]